MSEFRIVRYYDSVDCPYAAVCKILREPLEVFRRATLSAARRSREVAVSLHAGFAGVDVGVGVRVEVQPMREEASVGGLPPESRLALSWKAEQAVDFFPLMMADLSFWPVTSTETQLEIEGAYRPPLGWLGKVFDAVAGQRIAEATVSRFLREVAAQVAQQAAAESRT